jgi:hypothetical protein
MAESFEKLEATYGPAAPFSEYHRQDHIRYISAEGKQSTGTILWVQAPAGDISMRYIVAPDDPNGFLDFVWPADILTQENQQERALVRCEWCGNMHQSDQVEQCPLKPKQE